MHNQTIRHLTTTGLRGLAFTAGIAVAFAGLNLVTPAAAAAPAIGINLSFTADYTGEVLFADAMKEARSWEASSNGTELTKAQLDSNGWPTRDAFVYVWASQPNDSSGTYALSFNGQATVVVSAGTISNQTYNSGTNTTTATYTTNNNSLEIGFTNTKRTSGSATNTGVTNIKLMRPTSPGAGTSYATTTNFTTQAKNLFSKFQVLRFMDFLSTNGNQSVNWTDRTKPSWFSQSTEWASWQKVPGSALEYAVALSNETGKDLWIDIPVSASDAYITNVANLILYGSDGTNPYTSAQGSPVWAPLNAGQKVYVEFSNEVWNTGGGFTQSQTNHDAAVAEVNAGGSPLNFDGETSDWYWAARRTAKRTVEISNIFRTVFGSGAMMSRVRPVLESQQGYTSFWLLEQTHMLEDYYNTASRVATPHPPGYYIYGGAGSAYYNPDTSNAGLNISNIWTSLTMDVTQWAPISQGETDYALPVYGHRVAYEGGPSLDRCGCAADAVESQAWGDNRMTGIITGHQTNWDQNGGDLLVYYEAVGDFQWGFATTVNSLNTPKLTGIDQVNTSTKATGTYGVTIPGTLTASAYNSPATWAGSDPSNMTASSNWTWTGYSVHSTTSSAFNIALSAGSSGTSNQGDVYMDGVFVGTITIPNTGSKTTYATSGTVTTAAIAAGTHGILIKAKAGSFGMNSIIVTTGAGSPPPAPTGLTATAGNAQATLNWSASSGATSYNVKRSTVNGSGYATVSSPTGTSYTNSGLTNGTTYYFVVTAVNASGESGNSNQASATPAAGVPPVPSGLTATPGNAQVALSWNASSGATAYDVKRSTISGSGYATVSSPSTTNYTNTGLTNGTAYYFVVDAKNASGTSANSAQVSATPSNSSILLNDGTFSSIHASTTFTAGTSTLGQWYSQIGSGDATLATSGGNPGNFLQWGLFGNQMVVGIAASGSAQSWTVSFDYKCPQAWGGPNFKVFGLTSGQALPYAYGGATAGSQLLSVTPALVSSWTHVSYSVSVPAGKSVIALEWFGDVGQTSGIDNVKVTNP